MADDERDERLGAELRRLPVPDHDPGFWSQLHGRLAAPPAEALAPAPAPAPAGPEVSTGPEALADLDDRRALRAGRRRRRPIFGAAAAAVILAVVAAGLVLAGGDEPDRGVAATGPDEAAATALRVTYEQRVYGNDKADHVEADFAPDGSFRVETSSVLQVYDAASRVAEVFGEFDEGPDSVFRYTDLPAGGPDAPGQTDPWGAGHVIVRAAAATGDRRVTTATMLGRQVWHFEGPFSGDQLGGGPVPDRMVGDVDQETGVALNLTVRAGDELYSSIKATSVREVPVDRARFRLDEPQAEVSTESAGFKPTTLAKAAAAAGYDLLVPEHIPAGFAFSGVTYDADHLSTTGPEGTNPVTARIVAMHWRNRSGQSFTVTLRPSQPARPQPGPEPHWDDPFGTEGRHAGPETVRLELAGRPALEGEIVFTAPYIPHLWGVTGDVVVTVDGDLARDQLRAVASSLQPHS